MASSLPFDGWGSACMIKTQGSHEEEVRRAGCEEESEA